LATPFPYKTLTLGLFRHQPPPCALPAWGFLLTVAASREKERGVEEELEPRKKAPLKPKLLLPTPTDERRNGSRLLSRQGRGGPP
jgi:hypothetical protein